MAARFSFFFITILILVFPIVEGRILEHEGSEISSEWISDGVEHNFKNQSNYLSLGNLKELSSGDQCNHIYGFFPCAENIGGYLFMIVTFQYLLILGEKVLAIGSNRLFSILDTGIFGASVFPTLITWPRIVMAFGNYSSNTQLPFSFFLCRKILTSLWFLQHLDYWLVERKLKYQYLLHLVPMLVLVS